MVKSKSLHHTGPFKQINKKHKSRFANRKEKKIYKHKPLNHTKKLKKSLSKDVKVNQATQERIKKISSSKSIQKLQEGMDFKMAIVPLFQTFDCATIEKFVNLNSIIKISDTKYHLVHGKINCYINILDYNVLKSNLFDALDVLRVMDYIIFILPPTSLNLDKSMNLINTHFLECALVQGITSNIVFAYEGDLLDDDTLSQKSMSFRDSYKKGYARLYQELLQKYLPQPKIMSMDRIETNLANFYRQVIQSKRKNVQWIQERPVFIIDDVSENGEKVTLHGHIHSVNKPILPGQTIHIPALQCENYKDGKEPINDFIVDSVCFSNNATTVSEIMDDASLYQNTEMTINEELKEFWGLYTAQQYSKNKSTPLNDNKINGETVLDKHNIDKDTDITLTEKRVKFQNDQGSESVQMEHDIEQNDLEDDEDRGEFVRLHPETQARERYHKYRGLKSFKDTPWPKDDTTLLPPFYSDLMQFKNYKLTVKNISKRYQELVQGFWDYILQNNKSDNLGKDMNNDLEMEYEGTNNNDCGSLKGQKSRKRTLSQMSLQSSDPLKSSLLSLLNTAAKGNESDSTQNFTTNFTLTIKGCPSNIVHTLRQKCKSIPILAYGLFPYEQAYSQANLVLRKTFSANTVPQHSIDYHDNVINYLNGEKGDKSNALTNSGKTIDDIHYDAKRISPLENLKSKSPLIFLYGFRRFTASVLFSEHNMSGDKYKFEKYFDLKTNQITMASLIAPIMMTNMPILTFTNMESGSKSNENLHLVAHGSLHNIDPSRCIIKRIILKGNPYKINGRLVIVRHMFYNIDDINWFKDIQLRSKQGKIGHIKEPVGTHGHMKCTFNSTLKSQDSIYLYLYKRVFPKWDISPLGAN